MSGGYALLRCHSCWSVTATPWANRSKAPCGHCGAWAGVQTRQLICVHCERWQSEHVEGHLCLFSPTVFDPRLKSKIYREVWENRCQFP